MQWIPSYILDLIGTAVFAITGALAAGRKRMDTFGVVILGCVTAVGGGTLRDVLAGEIPLIFHKEIYASASLAGATLLALSTRLQGPASLAILLSILTTLGIRLAALH